MAKALLALALGIQAMTPAAKFDSGRAWEHLRQLVAIGPRPSGSSAIEQTRKYIREQLAANGLTAVDQAWDDQTPPDKVHMVTSSPRFRVCTKSASSSRDITTRSCIASSDSSARATADRARHSCSSSRASSGRGKIR